MDVASLAAQPDLAATAGSAARVAAAAVVAAANGTDELTVLNQAVDDDIGNSFPLRLAVSAIVAVCAFGAAYFVRRGRDWLGDRVAPVAVDLGGAALTLTIAGLAVVAIAKLWDQWESLTTQLSSMDVLARAPQVAITVVVLIAIQVLTSVLHRLLEDITDSSNAVSDHEREMVYRLVQLTVWTVGVIVLLGVWEVDLGGLLVGAGFLGIILGLAARQTLGALLGGLVLMFSRPFEVGDWVEVGEDEGIVTDITVMNTSIQAFDGEYVVVPNDVISSQTIRNRTRKGRLRIEVEVGVDYATDVERAREVATRAVSELDIVMNVPRPETVTKALSDSAVTLGVRGWIEHPSSRRRWRARTGMTREIKRAFAEEGIKIPFPQRELSGRREQGGLRVSEAGATDAPGGTADHVGDDVDADGDGAATGTDDGARAGADDGTGAGADDGAATEVDGDRADGSRTPSGGDGAPDGGEGR